MSGDRLTRGRNTNTPGGCLTARGKSQIRLNRLPRLLRFPQVFNLPAREKVLARRDWVKVR